MKHVLLPFFGMFEAIAREYFHSACDHLLVTATEAPDIVRLIFCFELFTIYSLSEVGSEHQVCFVASLRPTNSFWSVKKTP